NTRIRGWMGRADQTTKVKGMFIRPEQIADIGRRHAEIGRMRLVVSRSGEIDSMTLKVESDLRNEGLSASIAESLRNITRLGGSVELVSPGALPNDGKVIEDTRAAPAYGGAA